MLATDPIVSEARLKALRSYGILDTPPEEGFDQIVELAATACSCSIALVSLIDSDRQWFKARIGTGSCQTDLNSSVCAYALTAPDILVIPDLATDPRTALNPLVIGDPGIRFYAGAPLRTPDGHVLGSLCVVDREPRPDGLTADQERSLKALAAQVMVQLELRRALVEQQQLVDHSEALIGTQKAVSEAHGDLDAILKALVLGAMRVIPNAEGCVIKLREGNELVYRATAGCLAAETGLRIPVHASMASSALATGKAILSGDVKPQVRGDLVERLNVRSCIIVPVILSGQAVGVLKVQSSRVDAFTRSDLRLARVFSGSVTTGLAEAAFRQQAESLRRMIDLGDKLRDAGSVEEAGTIGSAMAGQAFALDRAGYGAVDPDSETVLIGAHWGTTSISGRHAFRDFGTFIDDLKAGRPVIIDDVATDPRTASQADAFRALGIGALINLPTFERGRFVSVFFAQTVTSHRWTESEITEIGAIADRTRSAVAKLQAEAQQRVLNAELSHRMKNTMAMVQAVALQTLKGVRDRDAVAAFTDRVHALSSAHDVLMQASWDEAHIRPLVAAVLDNFRQMERFRIEGPDLQLGPRAVISISMLLHEMATNALKYGALSVDGGIVHLSWRIEPGADGSELVLDWSEHGGPPAVVPTRTGFGSRLIRLGLVGTGGVSLRYGLLGFEAEMRAPLAHVQQS